jgi:hypothetical protein
MVFAITRLTEGGMGASRYSRERQSRRRAWFSAPRQAMN